VSLVSDSRAFSCYYLAFLSPAFVFATVFKAPQLTPQIQSFACYRSCRKMSAAHLKDFNALINKFHSVLEVIRDEVTQTIESRNPAALLPIYSSSSQPLTSPKLGQAMKDLSRLSDKVSSFAMEPAEYLALITASFYESIALRIVSQLGVADAINEGQLTLKELAKKVNADEGRLCE
jgi:Golgi nucleoside diphosphatase